MAELDDIFEATVKRLRTARTAATPDPLDDVLEATLRRVGSAVDLHSGCRSEDGDRGAAEGRGEGYILEQCPKCRSCRRLGCGFRWRGCARPSAAFGY
jgi:hypothetical protein